jgi:hypothetical protein
MAAPAKNVPIPPLVPPAPFTEGTPSLLLTHGITTVMFRFGTCPTGMRVSSFIAPPYQRE